MNIVFDTELLGSVDDAAKAAGLSTTDAIGYIGQLVEMVKTGRVVKSQPLKITRPKTEGDSVDMVGSDGLVTEEIERVFPESKTFGDAISSKELRDLVPVAIEYIVREEIEPRLSFTNLLDKIPYDGNTSEFIVMNLPTIHVGEVRGTVYPKIDIYNGTMDSEKTNLATKKYGAVLSVTKEFYNNPYSGPYLNLVLRKVANAFLRTKETVVQETISKMGKVVLFDNTTPANGDLGHTQGRGIDGNFNGTLSPYDITKAYIHGYTNYGVTYDTLIMHPMAWSTFLQTPQLREILIGTNGQIQFPGEPKGSPAMGWGQYKPFAKLYPNPNLYGTPNVNDPTFAFDPSLAAKLGINPLDTKPGYMWNEWTISPNNNFFNHPLHVILSPTVPLVKASGVYTTDLYLAASGQIGAIFQAQEVRTRMKSDTDWQDEVDYKFDEIYAVYPYGRGEGFAKIQNITLAPQYTFDNVNSVKLADASNYTTFQA